MREAQVPATFSCASVSGAIVVDRVNGQRCETAIEGEDPEFVSFPESVLFGSTPIPKSPAFPGLP